ncbi:MAG: hypothetical protein RBU37_02355, partial [Myxococcota bacterium]|nr:hypothetical protein [Myxococcota bacterium]
MNSSLAVALRWSGLLLLTSMLGLTLSCSFDDSVLTPQACSTDPDCPTGKSCVGGFCLALYDSTVDGEDGTETGFACGQALCLDTERCCGESCISVAADPLNCGACGRECADSESCVDGQCVCGGAACAVGELCCDGSCSNLKSDDANCGACGASCSDFEFCVDGTCVCETGTGAVQICVGDQTCCPSGAGCRGLLSDARHCGACGIACGSGEVCDNGSCRCGDAVASGQPVCGFGESCCGQGERNCVPSNDPICDCGGAECGVGQLCCIIEPDPGNPIESCVYTAISDEHCGDCGQACGPASYCDGGQCICDQGFLDCDGDPSNGCETRPSSDVEHCGACNAPCPDGYVCDGSGQCALSCQAQLTDCSGSCIDTAVDPNNCGQCERPCLAGELCNGAGVCALTCQAGLENCGGVCTDLQTHAEHCGACNDRCRDDANATADSACVGAQCEYACASGYGDCDGLDNGCETNLRTSLEHCGGCGLSCGSSTDNATASCVNGVCQQVCSAGWADCDGNPANGCESNVYTTTNCGGCAISCGGGTDHASESCPSGVCTLVCDAGWEDCDGIQSANNGCETNIYTTTNCGGCGLSCGGAHASASCNAGICNLVCDAGWEDCDGNPANGCEVNIYTTTNCGGCGIACGGAADHAAASCAAGVCLLICDAGWEDV